MGNGGPEPLREDDPREIAGYVLEARIGEGGMGTVFLSRTADGRPVALKLIRREHAQSESFRKRFAREVEAARRVQGHHLVPVVDHDAEAARPWLATRYVPGLPLDDALQQYGPLPLPCVLQLTACAAHALDSVHAAGVIHRDVKPANLLLTAEGPWLLDFGIARAVGSAALTTIGRMVGTPRYMSPEHALGKRLTPASDVFTLGLVAAEAATGRHPYGEGGGLVVATRIAGTDREPPDLSVYPAALHEVLAACLAARPEDRPAAAEVAELCGRAAGRDVRIFGGWLPKPLAATVSRIERAAKDPRSSGWLSRTRNRRTGSQSSPSGD
ncbi:serine/threonine protein kinase [Streptomyces sp. NBC_01142]|uniref:serine/threonine-protein kinase n=1 Tax=Streptomyces sp. NBC_01142 TaxID=2975865 RepID=UPI002252163F|nr:serine/threonine-protein kinase [Streptomyces sp. NBC_01142]MCX4823494.1 serine/threonine protein kinase [Streptomyces sp. NBC_01142]